MHQYTKDHDKMMKGEIQQKQDGGAKPGVLIKGNRTLFWEQNQSLRTYQIL